MGKMYTLKPDESINDHVKESMSIINSIVELSIGCMRDLANPREGTFVDMTYNKLMCSLEHIRESIEMLDEMCDELEDDLQESRKTYAHDMECIRKYGTQSVDAERLFEQLNEDLDYFRNLAISRNKELEEERERSNQLEKECSSWEERCAELNDRCDKVVEHWTKHCENLFHEHRKSLAAKDREIADLTEERDYYQDCLHKLANRASNFCGNCKHCKHSPMGFYYCFEKIKTGNIYPQYVKVDPDDASCEHFESNKPKVVIDKPEFPCCEHCSHEDCDNCTLCPF